MAEWRKRARDAKTLSNQKTHWWLPKWREPNRSTRGVSDTAYTTSRTQERTTDEWWSGQMKTLANGVVGESLDLDENMLFETQHDVNKLIEQLEKRDEEQA